MGSRSKWAGQPSRHERGYGSDWVKLRLRILKRDDYLCQCPDCLGGVKRLRPATEVDHIVPKAKNGDDSPENLRSVNGECHRKLGLIQKGYKPKKRIGLDGYPVE
ncbi:MAG: HNH endonuclease [Gemmataceae bacterium]